MILLKSNVFYLQNYRIKYSNLSLSLFIVFSYYFQINVYLDRFLIYQDLTKILKFLIKYHF